MRFQIAAIGVAVTLAGLGLVACGDDSGTSSATTGASETSANGSAAPETSAGASAEGALAVTASEPSEGKYAFDIPDVVEGGTVELTLNNTGKEPHELGFVKVTDGTTTQQFADEVLGPEGAPIPEYVLGAPGGLGGVAPGGSNSGTISLDEGTYIYFCTFGDPPHWQNGMLGEFTVEDVGSTAALPDTSASVDASEYKFDVNGLQSGENTLTFSNKGQQFHHLVAVPMNEGATLDDVKAAFSSEDQSAPPPVNFDEEQDLAVLGPGQSQVATLTLDKGAYVFLCFLNDRQGGPPHFTEGMLQEVDIS